MPARTRKAHSRVDQLVAERDDLRTRAVELENAGDGTRDELARVRKSLAKERDGAGHERDRGIVEAGSRDQMSGPETEKVHELREIEM